MLASPSPHRAWLQPLSCSPSKLARRVQERGEQRGARYVSERAKERAEGGRVDLRSVARQGIPLISRAAHGAVFNSPHRQPIYQPAPPASFFSLRPDPASCLGMAGTDVMSSLLLSMLILYSALLMLRAERGYQFEVTLALGRASLFVEQRYNPLEDASDPPNAFRLSCFQVSSCRFISVCMI